MHFHHDPCGLGGPRMYIMGHEGKVWAILHMKQNTFPDSLKKLPIYIMKMMELSLDGVDADIAVVYLDVEDIM